MSEATTSQPAQKAGPTHHRSAKNYLLDRRFQLKYSGFLVAIAVLISGALGALLWDTNRQVVTESRFAVEQGHRAVQQGQEAVKRGEQVLAESRKVREVVEMSINHLYKDTPELAKTFNEDAARDEAKIAAEQKKLEQDAAALAEQTRVLETRADTIGAQQRRVWIVLPIALIVFVLGIAAAGIVFTHKVAGPLFKMRRLLAQIGNGKLVLKEKLRKGDELQEFFGTFEKMVSDLRAHQEGEIAKVDEILLKLEAERPGDVDRPTSGLSMLKKLRADMQDQLGG